MGAKERSVKSAGCPWISSVVTQPHAPWRSFRQLSRTRPVAVLNSSLQSRMQDERLQHAGQFPYKPTLPPCCSSLTPLLLMPPGSSTVLMNIAALCPARTHNSWMLYDEKLEMRLRLCPSKPQRKTSHSEGQKCLSGLLFASNNRKTRFLIPNGLFFKV